MSTAPAATVPAAAAGSSSASASAAAAPAPVMLDTETHYTHTTFLTTLTNAFNSALSDAADRVATELGQAQGELPPEYYVEATKAALRQLLAKQYTPAIASAYSASFTQSAAPSPVGSPVHTAQDAVDPNAPKKKPIRTYIGSKFPHSTRASSPQSHGPPASTRSRTGAMAAAMFRCDRWWKPPCSPSRSPSRLRNSHALDGCFDIMHSGHYNAIRQAKALTDILVVGVHSDEEIRRHKGPPVMSDEERLATVRACKWVDEVVFNTPYDPSLELLIKLDCDYCVHGDDLSTTADGRDAYAEVKEAGRMKVVKRTEGVSTTDLVGRLLLMTRQHHIGNSPALGPLAVSSNTSSPSLRALSSNLKDTTLSPGPPSLTLEPTAASPSSPSLALPPTHTHVRKASDVGRAAAAGLRSPERPAAAVAEKPISNFLPTTWRITQFSNHRTPLPTDKIVYIDGAFDLFHVGHIETLKKAKEMGDFLYVGIHDDATINLHKGRNYPIMNLHERVMNVLSCKYVDEVVIGAPWKITKDLLTSLNIHCVVSGTNTKMDRDFEQAALGDKAGEDAYAEAKAQGIFKEIETTHSLTTEDVVRRLIKNREDYEKRNAKRAPKESAYLSQQKQFIAEI